MRRSALAGGGRGGKEYPVDNGAELFSAAVGHQGEGAAMITESVRASDSYKEWGALAGFLTSPPSSASISSLLLHSSLSPLLHFTLYFSPYTLVLYAPSESLDEAHIHDFTVFALHRPRVTVSVCRLSTLLLSH